MNVAAIATNSLAGSAQAPRDLNPAKGAITTEDRKKVAAQFEAILVRQLLSESLGSMLNASSGAAGNVYGYMLTDVLAEKLTSGRGLGLAKLVEQQLTPRTTAAETQANQ